MSGRSFKGDIYIGFIKDGEFTGYLPEILNVDDLSFTPAESESQDRISRKRVTDGQTLDSYSQATGATTMSLTTDEMLPEILAAALLGDAVDVDIDTDTVTKEKITLYHGRWSKLENVNIEADGFSVEESGGGDTYVKDTDYKVDRRTGFIMAIAGGGIDDGDEVQVDYGHKKLTGFKITGQTVGDVRCRIYGDMEDRVTGRRGELVVHDVRFRPSEAVNLMLPEGFIEAALEGRVITPTGEDGPFTFREIEIVDD